MEDGTVKAFGTNTYGQLGSTLNNGKANVTPTPAVVAELSGIEEIAVGNLATLVRLNNGTVKAFGLNNYGQLGLGVGSVSHDPNPVPVEIPGLAGVKQISMGAHHSLVLLEDGTLLSFGSNSNGQMGIESGAGYHSANPTPTVVNL